MYYLLKIYKYLNILEEKNSLFETHNLHVILKKVSY
jgi:hypothetical protein